MNERNEKEMKMRRWSSLFAFAVAIGVAAMLPSVSFAGAMVKEHECVGKDTALDLIGSEGACSANPSVPCWTDYDCYRIGSGFCLQADPPDAGCTPVGSPIMPPHSGTFNGTTGAMEGAEYGPEDVDEFVGNPLFPGEGFFTVGAVEKFPRGSNQWQTIPTEILQESRLVGFDATHIWRIGLKSSQIFSNLEISCSVCAMRPQGGGDGQTYVPDLEWFNYRPEYYGPRGSGLIYKLNQPQEPWRMTARQICGKNNTSYECTEGTGIPQPGKHLYVNPVEIPGLERIYYGNGTRDFDGYYRYEDPGAVEFLGCKPKVLVIDNPGGRFAAGDLIEIAIQTPNTARVFGMFDATSCEVSYIRGCQPAEGIFPNKDAICGPVGAQP